MSKISNQKKNARKNFAFKPKTICPHCRKDNTNNGHFVPPGFGSPGQWICAAYPDIAEQEEIRNAEYQNFLFDGEVK